MSDVAVRQATVFDLDVLAPLFDAYRQFYRKPADLALARRFLLERFEHNESVIFLALLPDGATAGCSLVGFAQLYPSFSSASAARILILNDLFVRPEARRKKVGSALLRAAARYGQAVGVVRMTLSTEITNSTAQALYEGEAWTRQNEFYVYNLELLHGNAAGFRDLSADGNHHGLRAGADSGRDGDV
jgi:ribosomal protein S18 acetylase RimI-like enzyme